MLRLDTSDFLYQILGGGKIAVHDLHLGTEQVVDHGLGFGPGVKVVSSGRDFALYWEGKGINLWQVTPSGVPVLRDTLPMLVREVALSPSWMVVMHEERGDGSVTIKVKILERKAYTVVHEISQVQDHAILYDMFLTEDYLVIGTMMRFNKVVDLRTFKESNLRLTKSLDVVGHWLLGMLMESLDEPIKQILKIKDLRNPTAPPLNVSAKYSMYGNRLALLGTRLFLLNVEDRIFRVREVIQKEGYKNSWELVTRWEREMVSDAPFRWLGSAVILGERYTLEKRDLITGVLLHTLEIPHRAAYFDAGVNRFMVRSVDDTPTRRDRLVVYDSVKSKERVVFEGPSRPNISLTETPGDDVKNRCIVHILFQDHLVKDLRGLVERYV